MANTDKKTVEQLTNEIWAARTQHYNELHKLEAQRHAIEAQEHRLANKYKKAHLKLLQQITDLTQPKRGDVIISLQFSTSFVELHRIYTQGKFTVTLDNSAWSYSGERHQIERWDFVQGRRAYWCSQEQMRKEHPYYLSRTNLDEAYNRGLAFALSKTENAKLTKILEKALRKPTQCDTTALQQILRSGYGLDLTDHSLTDEEWNNVSTIIENLIKGRVQPGCEIFVGKWIPNTYLLQPVETDNNK
jgi:hypothetical protein